MNEQTGDTHTPPAAAPRKYLRAPLIVLKVKLDDGRRSFFGYTKNISRSGIFIASVNPKEPGTRYQVEIPLPEPINREIDCTCEVVWKRHYAKGSPYEPGMGLRFIDLDEKLAEDIDRWVQDHHE
ncbi:MAG TPA: PilZ domain-containing protein [Desulfuromonadales bacterium]|nr:PilZ domain-containing protein [Desulfuromonadales bacterium]